MKPESIEELRERLLREEQVKEMISMRAYEIYQMRGAQPGREAEDWLRAENEILSFLIQEESRRARESEDLHGERPQEPATVAASETLEPPAPQTEEPAKKPGSRAATKTGTGAKKPAAKKSAAKKSAAKKPSTKRAATKKSGRATQESEK